MMQQKKMSKENIFLYGKFNNPELSVQYHPHNLGLMNDSQSRRELTDNVL